MMEGANLTLSIVSHGHGAMLGTLLAQLNQEEGLAGTQLIVTLNLADEQFDATPYQNLSIQLIRNAKPKGFGANHNAAFAHCRNDWFAILNPDLRLLGKEPFTALIKAADSIPNLGLIAPSVVSPDGDLEDSVRANLTPASILLRRAKRYDAERALLGRTMVCDRTDGRFFWLAGMCLLVRSEAFRAIGGFDKRFHMYCEDYDLCARLWERGYGLAVDSDQHIIHDAQRDSHLKFRYLRWHLTSLSKVWLSRTYRVISTEI